MAFFVETESSVPRLTGRGLREEDIDLPPPVFIRFGGGTALDRPVWRADLAGLRMLGSDLVTLRGARVVRAEGIRFLETLAGRITGRGREETRLAR